jgi:toxin YoeB
MSDRLLTFTTQGWEDYQSWVAQKPTLRRINRMIDEARRTPEEGIGRPEPLVAEWAGYWSRRVTESDRMVYSFTEKQLVIVLLRGHYYDH